MPWHDLPRGPAELAPAVISAGGAVKKAQGLLQSLERKLHACRERGADLQTERAACSFAAHTGDRGARKELDGLHEQIVRHDSEIKSLEASVDEAKRRLADAQAAAVRTARCADATQALELASAFRAAGVSASEALTAFLARFQRFQEISRDLHFLNVGAPSGDLVRVNAQRAVSSALHPLGLGQLQPPSQRKTLPELVEVWASRIEIQARQILGEGAEEAV